MRTPTCVRTHARCSYELADARTTRLTSVDEFKELEEEWLSHLRIEKGASVHTLSNYRRDLDRYRSDMEGHGITKVSQIGPGDIERHLRSFARGDLSARGAAPSSVARASAAIRGFHRFVVREGHVSTDPAAQVKAPKQQLHLPKALSVEQVAALLDAAKVGDGPIVLRDSALLELLYASGARVSEAVSLALDDIQLGEDIPIVRLYGKGRKERIVPLGTLCQSAIEAYLVRARPALALKGRGTPSLFLNTRGAPLSRQGAWEAIRKAAARAGLEGQVSPHTLRHSFATHLLQGGASIRDVQELLGHASVQTTQIYTKVTPTTLLEVYRSSHPRWRATADSPAQ